MKSFQFDDLLTKVRTEVVSKYGEQLLANKDVADIIKQEVRSVIGCSNPEIENMVTACLIGLGPVEPLLQDDSVSEIMINGPDSVYVERNGRLEKTDITFSSNEEVLNIIYRIVQRCGRRINFSSPLVDARLADGSRVNAVVPPSSSFPTVTIRKFVKKSFATKELVEQRFFSNEMAEFFKTAIQGKANIIVAGATGSGKTTFLRWLANQIPARERIITIEDTRELAFDHPHVVSLEATDKADIYDLMINSLRMRPDRIILGEVRGAEAFELLQAMGTGHEGSLTTVHANYGRMEAIHRLVRAMIRAGGMTAEELISMIAETVDLLVFVKRFANGQRRILHVTQVTNSHGNPEFNDIFRYEFKTGSHIPVGNVTAALAQRLRENLEAPLPDLKAFKQGGSCVA